MALITCTKRKTEDYHHLATDHEDVLDYLSQNQETPGIWMGPGEPQAGKEVLRDDFVFQNFGFQVPEVAQLKKHFSKGYNHELIKIARLEIQVAHIKKAGLMAQATKLRMEHLEKKRHEKTNKKTTARIEKEIQKQQLLLKSFESNTNNNIKSLKTLKKELEYAKKEAYRTGLIKNKIQNPDIAGLCSAQLKTRINEIKDIPSKQRTQEDTQELLLLQEIYDGFNTQKELVQSIRDLAKTTELKIKSNSIEIQKLNAEIDIHTTAPGTEQTQTSASERHSTTHLFDRIEQLKRENSLLTSDKRRYETGLKDMPLAGSQGITVTLSFHKTLALAKNLARLHSPADAMKIERAMDETVRELVNQTLKKYIETSVQENGVAERVSVSEYSAAVFKHNFSRETEKNAGADPSDHFHIEILKSVKTIDGRILSLDATKLMQNIKLLGTEANAILSEKLVQEGFAIDFFRDNKGNQFVGLKGFMDAEIADYSQRNQAISKAKLQGMSDQEAWNTTRLAKERSEKELSDELDLRLKNDFLGWDKNKDAGKTEQERSVRTYYLETLDAQGQKHIQSKPLYTDLKKVVAKLCESKTYFTENEIRQELYRCQAEARSLKDFEFNAESKFIEVMRNLQEVRNDKAIYNTSSNNERYFFSEEHLKEEMQTFDTLYKNHGVSITGRQGSNSFIEMHIKHLEKIKTEELGFDFRYREDQRKLIFEALQMTNTGLISALAGTGKTTTLEAIQYINEQRGRKNIFCASWNKATQQLASDVKQQIGENVFTIAMLKLEYEKGKLTLDENTTIFIDEAGLCNHNEVKFLATLQDKHKVQLIFQGDENQTSAVGSGQIFKKMVESGLFRVSELTVIQRQKNKEQKRATSLACSGDFAECVDIYRQQGLVQESFTSQDELLEKLATDFVASKTAVSQKIAIATKNADVNILNQSIREKLVEQKQLANGVVCKMKKSGFSIELAENDRVCFTMKSKKPKNRSEGIAGVTGKDFEAAIGETIANTSEFGTVLKIRDGRLWIQKEDKTIIEVKQDELPELQYGYSATVSKLQGSTYDESFFCTSNFSNSALSYVALSRHRNQCQIYATEESSQTLISDLSKKENKIDAIDVADKKTIGRIQKELNIDPRTTTRYAQAVLTEEQIAESVGVKPDAQRTASSLLKMLKSAWSGLKFFSRFNDKNIPAGSIEELQNQAMHTMQAKIIKESRHEQSRNQKASYESRQQPTTFDYTGRNDVRDLGYGEDTSRRNPVQTLPSSTVEESRQDHGGSRYTPRERESIEQHTNGRDLLPVLDNQRNDVQQSKDQSHPDEGVPRVGSVDPGASKHVKPKTFNLDANTYLAEYEKELVISVLSSVSFSRPSSRNNKTWSEIKNTMKALQPFRNVVINEEEDTIDQYYFKTGKTDLALMSLQSFEDYEYVSLLTRELLKEPLKSDYLKALISGADEDFLCEVTTAGLNSLSDKEINKNAGNLLNVLADNNPAIKMYLELYLLSEQQKERDGKGSGGEEERQSVLDTADKTAMIMGKMSQADAEFIEKLMEHVHRKNIRPMHKFVSELAKQHIHNKKTDPAPYSSPLSIKKQLEKKQNFDTSKPQSRKRKPQGPEMGR